MTSPNQVTEAGDHSKNATDKSALLRFAPAALRAFTRMRSLLVARHMRR